MRVYLIERLFVKSWPVNTKNTLLIALEKKFPDSSRTTLREWIQNGRVEVDGKVVCSAKAEITEDQDVQLGKKKPRQQMKLPQGVKLLYRDDHIAVVDKPAGILSVAKESDDGNHLHGILKRAFKPSRVFPVHRLDRETSGVLIFALSEKARLELREMFAKRQLERRYLAVVNGVMEEIQGKWNSLLVEGGDYVVRSSDSRGRRAITRYRVLKNGPNATLLELKLETGRKNQIRVHAADAGHPIAGDEKYGRGWDPVGRLCLHAASLSFSHPVTKQEHSYTSETPAVFGRALRSIDA